MALPCGVTVPVTYSSLELHHNGEDGTPRKHYSFSFKAGEHQREIFDEIMLFPIIVYLRLKTNC